MLLTNQHRFKPVRLCPLVKHRRYFVTRIKGVSNYNRHHRKLTQFNMNKDYLCRYFDQKRYVNVKTIIPTLAKLEEVSSSENNVNLFNLVEQHLPHVFRCIHNTLKPEYYLESSAIFRTQAIHLIKASIHWQIPIPLELAVYVHRKCLFEEASIDMLKLAIRHAEYVNISMFDRMVTYINTSRKTLHKLMFINELVAAVHQCKAESPSDNLEYFVHNLLLILYNHIFVIRDDLCGNRETRGYLGETFLSVCLLFFFEIITHHKIELVLRKFIEMIWADSITSSGNMQDSSWATIILTNLFQMGYRRSAFGPRYERVLSMATQSFKEKLMNATHQYLLSDIQIHTT
jgi:hypothetical protein